MNLASERWIRADSAPRLLRRAHSTLAILLLAGFFILPGCQRPTISAPVPAAPQWFEDITDSVGLAFRHDAGPVDGKYFLPQILGSGGALFDFDNDGRLDILLLQNAGPRSASRHRLYHQEPDGHFKDVSAGSGLDFAGFGMGVAVGDVNNDGWLDVVITENRGIRLFLNQGNGTFRECTREAGLESPLWAMSAALVDYDRDGWLDLVVVHYVDYDPAARCTGQGGQPEYCHPSDFRGTVTKLFHNRGGKSAAGAAVQFEDVTLNSGLGKQPGPGLGVVCADFDGDGWPDILVANDDKPNHLWINARDGTFREEAVPRGLALNALGRTQGNMGLALGDVDGDGAFDVFITHLTEETNTLWMQGPRGLFQDRTANWGLMAGRWRGTGFGTVLADFNHDGWLDLAIVNGRVSRGAPAGNPGLDAFWNTYAERNQLFTIDHPGHFADLSAENPDFCGQPWVGRGLIVGDVDGDGALDLLVTTVAGPARLYRNIAPKQGHWLGVRALDPALRRDAYGATITIRAGKRAWIGGIIPGQSYLSSHEPRAHFGLGPVDQVDAIQVQWSDGRVEVFPGVRTDQHIVLRKGEGQSDRKP